MKFTNGYWLTKPEFDMHFAIQVFSASVTENALRIVCTCVPAVKRGDISGHPTITVTFTAPAEDVIRVNVEHFRGAAKKSPQFEIYENPVKPEITETETEYRFRSGKAEAVISKAARGWRVTYNGDGKLLTESEYHAMAHAHEKATGRDYMIESLNLDVGELVYGLGERFTAFVKNGQVVNIWNGDGGTASELAYKNVPFYMTNRGYGVLVENTGDISYEVASEKVERVQFSQQGQSMTYDLIYGGTPKGVLEKYTALTGRPALPPAWSFGLWLTTSFTTSYDEETINSFVNGMAERDIPLSVFHYDCFWMKENRICDFVWDRVNFPNPKEQIRNLKEKGLHLCCWLNSYIAQDSPVFDECMEKGYFIRKDDGDVWQTDLWVPGMAIIDFTNPEACAWFKGKLLELQELGIDAFKADFGERIPVRGIKYYDGSDPLLMHNYYTYLYNKIVFEALEQYRGKGDAVVFSRSATVGCQQFPIHWNGDSSASFMSMAESLRSGLSIATSGFSFWSHDIAGFEQTATADLYKRWAAFGLLSSHSRLHGSQSYRVPWLFDEESCDVVRKFAKLKNRLMPYIYSASVYAHQTGIPVMRPMMMEFPEDLGGEQCDMQYMLGDSLLVAPVMHKDWHVDYYLPGGTWTNLLSGRQVTGGGWNTEKHDYLSLPLMVRPNSVIAMGSVDSRPDYDYTDGLELHAYCPEDGTLTVSVPDLRGNTAAVYELTFRQCACVDVKTDSSKPYTVIVHN